MASLNKVQLIGNLGRDPEQRFLGSGDAVTNIAVATSYKPKDKEAVTEWHRVVFFGRLAEIVAEYCRKGSSIYVEGRLQTRKYTDKDGIERYATEIVGENMQLLGGRSEGEGARESDHRQQRPAPASQRNAYADQKGNARTPPQRPASHDDDFDSQIPF